jgi:superfamily II DNA or RNA helicase
MLTALQHQLLGLEAVDREEESGREPVVTVSPTGGGKTFMMSERARRHAEAGARTLILTNRRILLGQSSRSLDGQGVTHSFLAAGYADNICERVEVGSVRTIFSRAFKRKKWAFPHYDYVEVDEAHANKKGEAEQLIGHAIRAGAFVCGWTASPIGIGHIYKRLIIAGTKPELRAAGLLVPCHVFAPDEPDLQGVQRIDTGEFSPTKAAKRIMETIVFADVFKEYERLNPERRPALLWAPGVEESGWFVKEFRKMGVSAAHIDGNTSDRERDDIFAASKAGDCNVVCSFGVLREGADMPWIYHGILVQACGALMTYIQIVGRLLRACEGKTECILQDHAGAWWRHGTPNNDPVWRLTDTEKSIAAAKKYEFEQGTAHEPMRCPNCTGIRSFVDYSAPCPHCGYCYYRSVRAVRMTDGRLVQQVGTVHQRKDKGDEDKRIWKKCLFAAAYSAEPRTVAQAAADFRRRSGHHLPPDMPNLPEAGSIDWGRPVPSVFPWLKKGGKVP